MRILILGGNGMLGHQLFKNLKKNNKVCVTLRQKLPTYEKYNLFNKENTFYGVDVSNYDKLNKIISEFSPEAVINAVGVIKQRPSSNDREASIEFNALFPHKLAKMCSLSGSRLVHMSTDCVFSGKKGNYKEDDSSDAEDVYGKTKYLGELSASHCITFRTSIIGRELAGKKSLFEWFLAQSGKITGYRKAIFSGFTTIEFSRIVGKVLKEYPEKSGIYHVSSAPISKYELLLLFRKYTNKDIEIGADDNFICDRSLNSTLFRSEFKYSSPEWEIMIEELVKTSIR